MYADPTARAPRVEPTEIPAESIVLVNGPAFEDPDVEAEFTFLLTLLAKDRLLTDEAAEVAHGPHGDSVFGFAVPFTVDIARFEAGLKALAEQYGEALQWTYGPIREVTP